VPAPLYAGRYEQTFSRHASPVRVRFTVQPAVGLLDSVLCAPYADYAHIHSTHSVANLHLPATTRAKVTPTENRRKISHANRGGQISEWTEIAGLDNDGQYNNVCNARI